MFNLMIFGAGKSSHSVYASILKQNCCIIAYLDNDLKKQGQTLYDIPVISPRNLEKDTFDYIIIASLHFKSIGKLLEKQSISTDKIINFYDLENIEQRDYKQIFNMEVWRYCALKAVYENKINQLETRVKAIEANLKYEILDPRTRIVLKYPMIISVKNTIEKIKKEKKSLVRFGDGEFELMAGRKRARFQQVDQSLSKRLKEIIHSNHPDILIAIADNYGSLEEYESDAAEHIRQYLTQEVRRFHMSQLEMKRYYYNAYLTRPYIIYREKQNAKERFEELKSIWEKREIVIIEGNKTRAGVKNDLFMNTSSIERILCPNENAFAVYERILEAAKHISRNKLILIALGPTATILAYDLGIAGYQALDIGHVDLEYEWYLTGKRERSRIPYKYDNESMDGYLVEEIIDTEYERQIVKRISC